MRRCRIALLASLSLAPNPVAAALRRALDDSRLGATVWTFPNDMVTRARAIIGLAGDWQDHYAASAIYLRLNGVLPPTAKPEREP
jgi:hypothetical protein